VPLEATTVAAGDPVCSLSAEGTDAQAVLQTLERGAHELLNLLETAE
jgi:phosphotransferase system HPr-like phosphotransfer protein